MCFCGPQPSPCHMCSAGAFQIRRCTRWPCAGTKPTVHDEVTEPWAQSTLWASESTPPVVITPLVGSLSPFTSALWAGVPHPLGLRDLLAPETLRRRKRVWRERDGKGQSGRKGGCIGREARRLQKGRTAGDTQSPCEDRGQDSRVWGPPGPRTPP